MNDARHRGVVKSLRFVDSRFRYAFIKPHVGRAKIFVHVHDLRVRIKRGDVVEAPLADSDAQKSDWAPRLPLAKRPWDEYDDDRERPTFDSWGSDDI